MRLKRLLSTIEINHSSNKPIYPITFEIDNDNNALIRSVMSTKLGRKDRHSSEFQKKDGQIFFIELEILARAILHSPPFS